MECLENLNFNYDPLWIQNLPVRRFQSFLSFETILVILYLAFSLLFEVDNDG